MNYQLYPYRAEKIVGGEFNIGSFLALVAFVGVLGGWLWLAFPVVKNGICLFTGKTNCGGLGRAASASKNNPTPANITQVSGLDIVTFDNDTPVPTSAIEIVSNVAESPVETVLPVSVLADLGTSTPTLTPTMQGGLNDYSPTWFPDVTLSPTSTVVPLRGSGSAVVPDVSGGQSGGGASNAGAASCPVVTPKIRIKPIRVKVTQLIPVTVIVPVTQIVYSTQIIEITSTPYDTYTPTPTSTDTPTPTPTVIYSPSAPAFTDTPTPDLPVYTPTLEFTPIITFTPTLTGSIILTGTAVVTSTAIMP